MFSQILAAKLRIYLVINMRICIKLLFKSIIYCYSVSVVEDERGLWRYRDLVSFDLA